MNYTRKESVCLFPPSTRRDRSAMQLPDWTRRRSDGPGTVQRPILESLKANIGSLNRLPTLPEAASKAMAIAKDPNSSLCNLSAVIERDPAMATGILRLANSPLYGPGRAIKTVHHAVVLLGMRECQNLILAIGMRSLFRNLPRNRQLRYEGLWRHSFFTACVCRQLNRILGLDYEGEEFACGLSHDIGRILIGLTLPEVFDKVDPMTFNEGPDLLSRERASLETDHCYIGAWFASYNQLPGGLVTAIQFHHTPAEAPDNHALTALVSTADHMANHYQRDAPN